MENLRLFVDLPLEMAWTKQLAKDFHQLSLPWQKLKIIPVEQMHITLKFLGNTPMDRVEGIVNCLNQDSLKVGDIILSIAQPLIFSHRHPRVLALGLTADKNLEKLFALLEDNIWQNGLAHKEMRRFTPHLTMARITERCLVEEFKNFLNWRPTIWAKSINPSYFELQESILTKSGPRYNVLQTFDL